MHLLLVESDAAASGLRQALEQQMPNIRIVSAGNGNEALEILFAGEAARPCLVLMDLDLPGKDGREVLAEIKANPNLKHIPVIVMTASSYEQDILRSYQLYANCYITKPSELNQYNQTIQAIENFWLTCVHLPAKS